MLIPTYRTWHRREFLHSLSIATGATLLGLRPEPAAAEPPPETTTIRLIFDPKVPILCYAPQYVAKEFLRIEGFTDVRYVPQGAGGAEAESLSAGHADITTTLNTGWIVAIDRGEPVVVLSGLHAGCFEIFASDQVRSIHELKGKRVAVATLSTGAYMFLGSIAAYIGLDPNQDIEWVIANPNQWADMLAKGEVDAIGTFPPMGYDIQARKIGHVLLNTTTDDPWRHYFCCMVGAHREFAENYPVATKRALRAMLKANQLCSLEPQQTARWLVDKGFASRYDYALKTLQDVQYGAWRDYDPADTLRFYSLRLREAGIIQRTPQDIIAQGTDWRFLDALKKELKA